MVALSYAASVILSFCCHSSMGRYTGTSTELSELNYQQIPLKQGSFP
jgi:hypothetical protein